MTTINAQINPSTKIVAKHITLHNVTATDVGLANVDNTSDLNKPVSTAQQSALDLKADQATTYTKVEVDSNIANLVDTAPATLDTLNELAAALGDDANFAATTASALGEKLAKASNLSDLADAATARTNLGLLSAATTESTDYATAAQGAKADTAEAFTSNVSAFGSNLVDDVNAAAARTTLELGNVTNESKATMFTNPSFTGDLTTFSGETKFDKKVKITPEKGLGLQLFSSGSNNSAVSLQVQGPTTVGHDLFQRSGFTNGFGDGSNHFHSLIDINRIEQEPDGDVQNIERVQERYYAIQDNLLPNNKAVFWAQHRVARPISTTIIDTSTATLDVSLFQNSSNRNANNQVFFVSNTTPLNKSEELTITAPTANNIFSGIQPGTQVRMEFGQAFVGPIVAAQLFGKVTSKIGTNGTEGIIVELYGGNYKTTSEVPLGTDQTALTFDEVTLETIGTNTIVQSGNETNLQLYSKTNFTPNRLKDETLKATWLVAHGLVKNEHCTLITDGRGDLEIKQAAYVLDPDPDSDGLSVILVYGKRIKQFDLSSFTAFGSSNWTLHKGSIDGIHDDTLGDNLFNFNANNKGEYTAYQIGPGSQTDADCIAIGKNVYNKDASTIKIGYDNAMLDVRSNGIVVDGGITIDGNIAAKSTGTGAGGAVTGNDLTIEAGQVAGDGSTAGDLLLDGGRALAISGQTVTDGKVKIGSNHTTKLEITPDTEISGDLSVSGDATITGDVTFNEGATTHASIFATYGNKSFNIKNGMLNGTLKLQTTNSSGATSDGLRIDGDSNVSIPNGSLSTQGSITVGNSNTVYANNSLVVGIGNTANRSGNYALGDRNVVGHPSNSTGGNSAAIGSDNVLHGGNSFVAGNNNNILSVTGANSFESSSIVGNNNNISGSLRAFILGQNNTITNANNSVAIGKGSNLTGNDSIAVGTCLNDAGDNDTVILGRYNADPGDSSKIVIGAGFSDASRYNAIEIESKGAQMLARSKLIFRSLMDTNSYSSDSAAAAAGVVLGELYRDGNTVKIRMT